MASMKKGLLYFAVFIVILSMAVNEVESRRLVLRGRRTITRHYYTRMMLPAWLIIVIVAFVDILIGAILYFVLRKVVLSPRIDSGNSYQPALVDETS